MITSTRTFAVFVFMVFAFSALRAVAATNYDEAVSGEISSNRLVPTHWVLSPGVNSLIAGMGTELVGEDVVTDQDYLRIDVPAGLALTEIRLQAFESQDSMAFVGIQSGTTFSFEPDEAFSNIGSLLGWSHFGPGMDHEIGDDILPGIAAGFGAIGFTPPLAGGSYTLWLQQTGGHTEYQFDFVVAPEPAACLLGLSALTGIAMFARRRRRIAPQMLVCRV